MHHKTTTQRAITLAKDSLALVPIVRPGMSQPPRVLSITIATRTDLPAGATFNAELRRAVELAPQEPIMHESLSKALAAKGLTAEADEETRRALYPSNYPPAAA